MKKQLFILLLLVSGNVLAQRAAVKTNLLHHVQRRHLRLLPSGRLPPAGHSMLRKRLSVELCGQPEVEILDDAG